jgi:hypothetical protein
MQQQALMTETARSNRAMVSSVDVNGTSVFSPAGDHLGHIAHLMIDKASGQIGYAVMAFGGFLGLGQDETPVPWRKLRFDTNLGGYVTDITKDQLTKAPKPPADWSESHEWRKQSYDYYGQGYYW